MFVVTSSEVRLRLLVCALKRQKFTNIPRAEPKPLEIESLVLNRKFSHSGMWFATVFEYLNKFNGQTKVKLPIHATTVHACVSIPGCGWARIERMHALSPSLPLPPSLSLFSPDVILCGWLTQSTNLPSYLSLVTHRWKTIEKVSRAGSSTAQFNATLEASSWIWLWGAHTRAHTHTHIHTH